MSDQDKISPYHIKTISSRQVMRIKKNIKKGIVCWSNTKFSKLTSQELYDRQQGEITNEILGVKQLKWNHCGKTKNKVTDQNVKNNSLEKTVGR